MNNKSVDMLSILPVTYGKDIITGKWFPCLMRNG